jgi:hypothetical protein
MRLFNKIQTFFTHILTSLVVGEGDAVNKDMTIISYIISDPVPETCLHRERLFV